MLDIQFDLSNTGTTVSHEARYSAFYMPSGLVTVTTPPPGADAQPVIDAVGLAIGLDAKVAAINADKNLSQGGKATRIAEVKASEGIKTRDNVDTIAQRIDQAANDCNAAVAALYAAPRLDPGDAVAALGDQAVVSYLSGLTGAQLSDALHELPDRPRWIAALLRQRELVPLPGSIAAVLDEAHKQAVAKQYPQRVADVEARREHVEWLQTSIRAISAHVGKVAA